MSERLQRMKAAIAPREIELSIGSMLIKPVKLENLVMARRIPLTLVRKMEAVQKRTKSKGVELEDAMDMTEAINAVVIAAAVDPRVTEEETADSIAVHDVPFEDRVLIFTEANRPAAELAGFPGQPDGGDAAAPGGGEVREAAE